MKNLFLQHDVPGEIQAIVTAFESTPQDRDVISRVVEEVTLTRDDNAYYTKSRIDESDEPTIVAQMLKVVDMNGYTGDRDLVLDELYFLYALGLAAVRGTTYYILQEALDLFYGHTGFFQTFAAAQTPLEKDAALQPIEEYMLKVLLPGRYRRAEAAKAGLFAGLQPSAALEHEMHEIDEKFFELQNSRTYKSGVSE